MDLGWPHRRCILCLREPSEDVPFSRTHLIPESVRGFAWAWTMCKECNETVGSTIEAGLVDDISIRLAVEALANELPDLAERFATRDPLVASTPEGLVRARRQKGGLEILTTPNDDGSLTQSRESARGAIEKRLRREGRDEGEVAAGLALFDQATDGVPVHIGDDLVTHGSVEGFQQSLDGEFVTDAFPSLVAFNFLAFVLGPHIYGSELNTLRAAIRAGEPRSDWHAVERFIDRGEDGPYVPRHLVGLAQTQPHIVVRVQLFGWNVWRVHLPRIASKSEPQGLLFELETQTVRFASPYPVKAPLVPPPR